VYPLKRGAISRNRFLQVPHPPSRSARCRERKAEVARRLRPVERLPLAWNQFQETAEARAALSPRTYPTFIQLRQNDRELRARTAHPVYRSADRFAI
jgi:hypothetical protein